VRAFAFAAALALAAASAAAQAPTYSGDCAGRPAEDWLPGRWTSADEKIEVRFVRDGGRIVWRYDRASGVVTERWGEKKTATAEGEVVSVAGCAVEMRGRYTAYGGTSRAVGTPMEYSMTYDGRGGLAGSGLGFGRERFSTRWVKAGP
jgi:hypothetical protein